MVNKALCLIALASVLLSCSGKESKKIASLQKKDKKLSCKEILLEMNEAEFYRNVAYKNRGPKLKNVLMPLGYISTYMDAGEAIDAAEARVDYLDRIYQILRCEERAEKIEELGEELGGLQYYSPQDEVPYYRSLAR
ncbi:MAG: hypothetical protein PQ612_01700 [Rickettsiales bacterium]|nr:hypothetical protein [Pseudomonadota bacterium]MDA0965369.1 hypothetical protein [Pseudomonadota bacterium]MDG4544297.1 hypothetical protein [Rickettsiales bacterium]MDG4544858.1 hypothetical protein [Rickettsiales bacterium]MDG4546980.1 hypothetical protein [Rickettsiales bacterium]